MFTTYLAALVLTVFQGTPVDHVNGRAVFEEGGVQRPVKEGSFQFWFHRENHEWVAQDVKVRDGVFSIAVAPNVAWGMPGRLLLDGREAWSNYQIWNNDLKGDPNSTPPSILVARPLKPFTLTVVDGRTGAQLEDVEIIRHEPFSRREAPANEPTGSDWRRVGSKWKSPIELPAFETGDDNFNHGYIGIYTYWVRAPGHAWNRIRVDPSSGGERRVRLWPAMLFVGEADPPAETSWFATRTDSPEQVVELSWTRDGLFTPLDPGDWQLQIRPDGAAQNSTMPVFASVDVKLVEGSVTSISEDLAESLAKRATEPAARFLREKRQRVAGTVRIPAEWKPYVEHVRLVSCERERNLDPIEVGDQRWKQSKTDPELYTFEIDAVATGKWCLEIMPLSWRGTLRVKAANADEWNFSIPAPASSVRLFVIDAETKTSIGTSLEISSETEGRFADVDARREIEALEPGTFEFRAPSGLMTLSLFAPAFCDTLRTVTIVPGVSDHTIELHRAGPRVPIDVRVEAYDGEARIPATEIYPLIRAWSFDRNEFIWASRQGWDRYDEGAWNTIPTPGRYRFSLYAFDEYERPAPIEIDVTDAPDQRVVFHLKRIAR